MGISSQTFRSIDWDRFHRSFFVVPDKRKTRQTINKKSIADSFLTKELDFQTDSDAYSLKMAETKKGILHQLWKNQESICKFTTPQNSPMLLEFNKLSDKLILFYA